MAYGLLHAIVAYTPVLLPRMDEVRLDARVLAFTFLLALATALICGLLPAWHFAKADPYETLRSASTAMASTRITCRVRSILVAAEVGLSAVSLIAAGLLVHSFVRLLNVDRGFRA